MTLVIRTSRAAMAWLLVFRKVSQVERIALADNRHPATQICRGVFVLDEISVIQWCSRIQYHPSSEVGGENGSEAGVPHRESKPSAHRHRTARTTRQINGAIDFCG